MNDNDFSSGTAGGLPYRATSFWLSLAGEGVESCARDERGVPTNPLLAQVLPSLAEAHIAPCELSDPLGEASHTIGDRAVRQYRSRVLVRATGECFLFCRHCYRRALLPTERAFISDEAMRNLAEILHAHKEIREVLISGGDPLTASDEQLRRLIGVVRAVPRRILIRLCTRAPVVQPQRVTEKLVELLAASRPLHLILQINHPRELSEILLAKAEELAKVGIPLHSQSVLLRGINDDVSTLVELFSSLSINGIQPYYLFQGDLAQGTSHFRVPLSRGLDLYTALRKELSGLEMPRYAVDTPGGGGKVYLPEGIVERRGDLWILKAPDGSLHEYPEES